MNKLVNELITKTAMARIKASKIKIDITKIGDEVFVYPNNSDSVFNPKYMSVFQYFQLIEFESFIKKYDKLTEEEIDNILKASNEFVFLKDLKEEIPYFIEELKRHGAKPVAIIYVNNILYGNKAEENKTI